MEWWTQDRESSGSTGEMFKKKSYSRLSSADYKARTSFRFARSFFESSSQLKRTAELNAMSFLTGQTWNGPFVLYPFLIPKRSSNSGISTIHIEGRICTRALFSFHTVLEKTFIDSFARGSRLAQMLLWTAPITLTFRTYLRLSGSEDDCSVSWPSRFGKARINRSAHCSVKYDLLQRWSCDLIIYYARDTLAVGCVAQTRCKSLIWFG